MNARGKHARRIFSLMLISVANAAYGQTFYPSSDTREVNAFATGTDPDGTFNGCASDTYTGPITGFWSANTTAVANDPGPYVPASLPGAQPALLFTSIIAIAGVNNYQTNFLTTGDTNITDGTTDLYSASGMRQFLDNTPFNGSGNSFVTGHFQVSFTVSAPVQVELDQEVGSAVYTDTTGYAPPFASAVSEDVFTGPSVATVHYSEASTAGQYNDSSGYTTEKFILYPNEVYTFSAYSHAMSADDPTNPETPYADAVANWQLYATSSSPTIGSYIPVSSTGAGNYNSPTGWNGGVVPNGSCQVAYFGQAPVAQTISLDVDVTVGTVTFDSTNAYTINGPGTLTIDCPADGGHLNVLNGNHTINAQTTLDSDTVVDIVNPTDSLTMTALQPSAVNVTKLDPGTWAVNSLQATSLTINGGIVQILDQPGARNLSASISVLDSLSIAGTSGAWTGILDLTNNDLIVHDGNLATLTNQLAQGFSNGTWQGSGGILSSTAAANTTHLTTLGIIQNVLRTIGPDAITESKIIPDGVGAPPLYTTFDGQSVSSTDILIQYTYYGDANLDGVVDGSDYSRIDAGYLEEQTSPGSVVGWFDGDFNYDGVIDGSDYTLIDNAFNCQGAARSAEIGNGSAIETAQIAESETSVPEPTSLVLISLGIAGLLDHRWL